MKLKGNYSICEDQYGNYFAKGERRQAISKQYEEIIKAMKDGITEEMALIEKMSQNGLPETEAALLCAEFIVEFSDILESE